ncbi:pentatricopeptide repeat-containing protein At4g19191, mitochondrial-like [Wolffia australiana]
MSAAAAQRLLRQGSASAIIAAWNRRIKEAVDGGRPGDALLLFAQMRRAGHRPDRLTFPSALKACAAAADEAAAFAVHCATAKSPSSSDPFVQTALLNLYLKLRRLRHAALLFDEMPQRDLVTHNAMLMGFSHLGSLSAALGFFLEMNLAALSPDPVSFAILAEACAAAGSLSAVKSAHGHAIRAGAAGDTAVANTFVSGYSKCGNLMAAEAAFAELPDGRRTAVSWSSMAAAYARHGRCAEAAACFSEMRRHRGSALEAACIVSLLAVSGLSHGEVLHSLAIRAGLAENSAIGNAVITMYCNSGDDAAARRQFEGMPSKTGASWAAMIGGHALSGAIGAAVELFATMDEPDKLAAAVAIISAAGRAGDLELGRALHRRAIATGLDSQAATCNSLMDMYMKTGCPGEARVLFNSMGSARTVVSYTIMVAGLGLNGRCGEALGLLSGMLGGAAPSPNAVTFLAALQACRHGGLLEEACGVLAAMVGEFGLRPSVEHLACMAELMGRRGRVGAARRLMEAGGGELEGGGAGYVGLAKERAEEGRWGGVAEALVAMRRRGMKKVAGGSWVSVEGRRRSFLAQDGSHPETKLLEAVIFGLDDAMRADPRDFDLPPSFLS